MCKKFNIESQDVKNLYSALASYKAGYNLLPSEVDVLKSFNIIIK